MQRSRQATRRFGTSGLGAGRPATKDGHGLAADCVGWVQRWKLLYSSDRHGHSNSPSGRGLAGWAVGEGGALLPTIDE